MIPVAALPAAVVKMIAHSFRHPNAGMRIEIAGNSVNVVSTDDVFLSDERMDDPASMTLPRHAKTTARHAKSVS